MRLLSVTAENFRSYRELTTVNVSDFTALIGRNDVGKSSILEALEIFFNHQTVKLDQHDPSVHGQGKIVSISCVFDDLPTELTIDAQSITSLESEWLLNGDGRLEIVKRFDCRGAKPKEEVFARAVHPTDAHAADLLQLKNPALKQRAREMGADLEGVDQRSNTALRNAIRGHIGDLVAEIRLVPLSEEDGKKVWDQLQKLMPIFALFQADRPSKDDDPEVTDPMKIAVSAAVQQVEADLDEIKERVRRSALEVATRTLAKLRELDPRLAQELTPTFKAEPNWAGFKLTLTGDDEIPINKRGSGVRRLILLSFFRAEAERRRLSAESRRAIYAIEEPESSQHPDNQVMLIRALVTLSEEPHSQVLLTTHVPAVAAMVPTESIRLIKRDADGHPRISELADDVYHDAAECLGVLPDKRAQLAIYVEGPHDVEFVAHMSRLYRSRHQDLVDLDSDHRIAFVPAGGGNLKHWIDRRYLLNARLAEVHIYDSDDRDQPKYAEQAAQVNGRNDGNVAYLTQRREMENYIHPDCIAATLQVRANFTDWCDVSAIVAEQVHVASGSPVEWANLTNEAKEGKIYRAKKRLNNEAVPAMTLAQLEEVDAGGEVLGWLHAIRDRVA